MNLGGQSDRDPSVANGRAVAIGIFVMIVFAVITVRLYMLQVQQGEAFRSQSRDNFVQRKLLDHPRGEIYDRNLNVLVTNRPSVNVYVTPAFFPPATRMLRKLGGSVGLSRGESYEVSKALSLAVQDKGPAILLARDLDEAAVEMLRRRQEELDIPLEAVPVLVQPAENGYAPRMAAYIDPAHFPSRTLVLQRLQEVMGWTDAELARFKRRVLRVRGLQKYQDIIVRRDVPDDIEAKLALKVQLGDVPGVTVRRATAREYVHGKMAAHLLGYINELKPDELEKLRGDGYRLGDTIGRRGIEQTFEQELRGKDGLEAVVVDSKGRMQRSMLAESLREDVGARQEPVPGNRVILTLDLELQKAAEAAFDGRAGSVVVMEVDTGRLLVVTSTPSFDPNRIVGDRDERRRLYAIRDRRPMRFRAIQDHFAPGSTFKVVTALAGLKRRAIRLDDKVRCTGAFKLGNVRFRCWKDEGHKDVDLFRSLARSCDVYYYSLATKIGLDPIAEMGRAMGFGAPTGIEIKNESAGIMPDADWYRKHYKYYTLGSAVNVSIGQGAVSSTPLQLAVAFATLANGGRVYKPQVTLRIESYDSKVVREVKPELLRDIVRDFDVSPQHLAWVREGLRQVVNVPYGTAYRKRIKDLPMEVAGKTGTAQVAALGVDREESRKVEWKFRDHAWFGAFAPADDPKIVIIVFNEHGGSGSKSAAPIAMKVAQAWYNQQTRVAGLSAGPVTIARIDGPHLETLGRLDMLDPLRTPSEDREEPTAWTAP